ncbi:MAG: NAD(P)H-binding protein [Candidatus Acidiferrales bacterium]
MILIAGATGNIGSEVVSQLTAANCPTRIFIRDPRKAPHWGKDVEIAVGDFRHPESFARAAKGADSIFLVASGTGGEVFSKLLGALRYVGAPRVVFISGTVAEWPRSEVGRWFRDREDKIRNCGLRSTILRPCDFMSNTYQWIATMKEQHVVYNATGTAKAALIAPEDVAAVAVTCLTSSQFEGQTIGITGGESLSVPEQVHIIAEALKVPIRCVDISVQQAVENLMRTGMSESSARSAGEIYDRTRRGKSARLTRGFTKITATAPKTFREWVQQHSERF